MARSEAQKQLDYNNTYRHKFSYVSVKLKPREKASLDRCAAGCNQSLNDYIVQAIKERMVRDKSARLEEGDPIISDEE